MGSGSAAGRIALVAGAGGYLGGAITQGLVEQGWKVRGLIRRPGSARRVEASGATPVVGDVLDSEAVATASRGCDLLVHVAAGNSLGPGGPLAAERVRVEGCRHLVEAARANGVPRLVVGSGYWVYADNPGLITEDSPLDPRGESMVNRSTERVALDLETRGSLEVLVVRPGMVYGNGSWCRAAVEAIRKGTYRYVGDGSNPWSFVSLEDTGSGYARVAEAGTPGEVYNLVDGRPATWKEFGDFIADRLSRPRPATITPKQAVAIDGPDVTHHLQARRACSAAKMERLGWRPRYRDFRAGLSHVLPSLVDPDQR